jgi:hypothetical protein
MKIDQNLQTRLELHFKTLNSVAAARSFPPPATLAGALEKTLPLSSKGTYQASVKPAFAAWFITAAIEMWQRGVHSFLISASLTGLSPIWASVSGYYSSHYAVRALGHLLGYFQLHRRKRIVRLELQGGKLFCTFDTKHGGDREHLFYWRVVNRDSYFGSDPLFVLNNGSDDASDAGHRERCNYADHISAFPQFRPLDYHLVQDRIEHISQIPFSTPPIPRSSKFPDVESVQIVAYHRLVRFRQFVDEIAGGSNRFWNVHRVPSWARDLINFQLTEQGGISSSPILARI